MLVIDPDTCIDCEACIPACPVHAIWPEGELPEQYTEWLDKNKELFSGGANITEQKDPLDGALDLDAVQAKEKGNGWDIEEPSAA
jgi:ferredoxin